MHGGRQSPGLQLAQEIIEDTEKAGERLAAAGRRGEEDRLLVENRGHTAQLRVGEFLVGGPEPRCQPRVEAVAKRFVGQDAR